MALAAYLALVAISTVIALRDWRRGWVMIVVCGVVQDPVRKLTPGTPVLVSFLVMVIYAAMLFSARVELRRNLAEFSRRFANVSAAAMMFLFFLMLAALNGFLTFGLEGWKVPLLSLFTYLAPLPAIIVGYTWLQREEWLYRLLRIYAAVTSIALVGTALEYFRFRSPALGLVGAQFEYWRHLPGLQVRLLSGFYRSPDIMAWHAATLTAVALALAIRAGVRLRGFFWTAVSAGAFTACLLSGRRKAVYYVAAFCIVFLWRYSRRLRAQEVAAVVAIIVVTVVLFSRISSGESTGVYTRAVQTTQTELLSRLSGGVVETVRQSGPFGSGLGMATQGTHHLVGEKSLGWQEGGMAKLAVELGLPGLIALLILGFRLFHVTHRLTAIGDVPGSSQFARAMMFALIVANGANFLASAQAYTDAILTLLTAFFGGCLMATAALDERLAGAEGQAVLKPLPA